LCTLFQYLRDLAYDFFVALFRFRVAMILVYIMRLHYIFSVLTFDTF
jgi:hypothetical protein